MDTHLNNEPKDFIVSILHTLSQSCHVFQVQNLQHFWSFITNVAFDIIKLLVFAYFFNCFRRSVVFNEEKFHKARYIAFNCKVQSTHAFAIFL